MKLLEQEEFKKLNLLQRRLHLNEVKKYLERFPACKFGSHEFNKASRYLTSIDFCPQLSNSVYITFKYLLMKTPTKKKAVKKEKMTTTFSKGFVKGTGWTVHELYELYRTRSGSWKFRKRAKNGEILNHSYNSKALAIKGIEADFRLTKEMSELKWKEVKG